MRKEGRLAQSTWDDALDTVAAKLKEHKGTVGVVASPKLTNEENYLLAEGRPSRPRHQQH